MLTANSILYMSYNGKDFSSPDPVAYKVSLHYRVGPASLCACENTFELEFV